MILRLVPRTRRADRFQPLHRFDDVAITQVKRRQPEAQNVGRAEIGDDVKFLERLHDLIALRMRIRSEEHTSELQSLMRISYAVFCLKKKTKSKTSRKEKNDENKHENKQQVDNDAEIISRQEKRQLV